MMIRKRTFSIILALCVMVSMCITAGPVCADEQTSDNDFNALNVYYNDKLIKAYSLYDLEMIEESEGSNTYTYSGYNRNVTYKGDELKDLHGPTLKGILAEAGVNTAALKSTDSIEIKGYDNYGYKYLVGQLFKTRYFYPNADYEGYQVGKAVRAETMEGAVEVPVILSLDGREADDPSKRIDRIVFGQEYPNEQNYTLFTKYMIDYKYKNKTGTRASEIRIKTSKASTWSNVTKPTYKNKAKVPIGSTINYKTKYVPPQDSAWIVYTTDGTDPTVASNLYNYSRWGDINPVVLNKLGKTTVKVRTVGFGKKSSSIAKYTYTCIVGKPQSFKAAATSYDAATLTWNSNEYITGYEIYVATGKKYALLDTVLTGDTETLPAQHTYECKDLTPGTSYKYKIRAFVTEGEKTTYGAYTSVKTVKPSVAAPEIEDLYQNEDGDCTAQIQWSIVDGADGYEIQKSLYKSKKYSKVTVLEGNEEVTFSNEGLKTGKTYYYKVRAYRLVDGKKKYGSYSLIKSIKIY